MGRGLLLTSVVWSTKTDTGILSAGAGRGDTSECSLANAAERALAAIDTASERALGARLIPSASARLSPSTWLPGSEPATLSPSSRAGRGIVKRNCRGDLIPSL